MTKFSVLIEKLEKAPGPDRELDADIFRAIGLTKAQERHCKDWCRMDGRTDLTRDRYISAWAPAFTRSVDDALTLVPAGLNYALRSTERGAEARVGGAKAGFTIKGGEHPTSPAIALCIAALRARED